ncbi:PocR ligand-binding domain-containing protein [Tindallia californiensis]|uniref:PocR ligand-binding domain-containing protein n=1 Tax=Tindallia californiensis TaxID=159292 RepID=UPI0015A4DB59|nr:HD domain-containing phosphohydrolase [Tindallia californiensis]
MSVTHSFRLEKYEEFFQIQQIMTDFQNTTGLTALLMDQDGEPMTEASHQKICREFHKKKPGSREHCRNSNRKMMTLAKESTEETLEYQKCANGLINVAVPIVVEDERIATLMMGEFFLKEMEEPNRDFFKKQACRYEYDEDAYLESLQEVPILTLEQLADHVSFLRGLTEYVAEMIQGIMRRLEVRQELSAARQQKEVSLQQLKATEDELMDQYEALKAKDDQLRDSRERWVFAIEGSQDGVWDWKLEENKIIITEQWANMLGYKGSEVKDSDRFFAENIHPGDDERIHKIMKRFQNGEFEFHQHEFRMRHKDGTYRWILSRSKVTERCGKGKPLRITGTHTDVTSWREGINRLIATRKQLRFVLEGSGAGIWKWDLVNKTVYLDHGSRKILEISKEIITTDEWNEKIHPSIRREVLKEDEESVLKEVSYQNEILMQAADGTPFWVRVCGEPIHRDDQGKLVAFSGIITDITEEKNLEKAIEYQKQIFDSFFQQSPDGIVHLTDKMVIKNVNQPFSKLFGYGKEECIGKKIDDLIVLPEQLEEAERIRKLADRLQNLEVETIRYTKSRKGVPVIIRGGSILIDGKVAGYQATYKDISGQKEKEDQLKRALKETVNSFAKLSEKRDMYIYGHQQRVAQLAMAIGKNLGLSENTLEGLWIAAILHDIGKIMIPSEILSKPSKLTPLEFEFIKTHPQNAYEVLIDIDFEWPIAEMILQHHEKLDGSGYPQGLKDTQILMGAKILIVADVVEAISSHRPYRPALGTEEALKEIQAYSGIKYEPRVVEACVHLFCKEGFFFQD